MYYYVKILKNLNGELINDLVNNYSLKSILSSHVNLLSGGELQLLSLLKSIIKPKILFYDEPTNNLDQ